MRKRNTVSSKSQRRKAACNKVAGEAAVCGIDVGAKYSEICLLDEAGELVERHKIRTSRQAFAAFFADRAALPIALEAGSDSNWIRRELAGYGHHVTVADAKRVKIITDTYSKDDRRDARWLATILLRWPELLHPVQPRSLETETHRAVLRLRETLVETRVKQIASIRGILASFGYKPPKISSDAFARRVRALVPAELRDAVEPLLAVIESSTKQIRIYDKQVETLCATKYREATARMQSIKGVGPQTALAFTLELDNNAGRLSSSRAAGALVGLRPKRRESGQQAPELSITKAGNRMLRKLLIQCAHYILGRHGEDSRLRRWGLGLAARSSTKRGKRRAVVATARKLAVLLHTLWRTGESFDPWRGGVLEPQPAS